MLLITPSKKTFTARCVTTVGECRQLPWRAATVHNLGLVPQSASDSIITVHVDDKGRTKVLYAFNNPCDDVVTAKTRQMNDTLDVYFTTRRRGNPEKDVPVPEIYGCPATITNLGYEVVIDRSAHVALIIRGITGNGSVTTVRAIMAP
jgi:hypothetical protein